VPIKGAIFDIAHRLQYGNDRVYYHDRRYYYPQNRTLADLPVNGDELVATGEKVIGLPVMDTPSSIQFQKERNVVPTMTKNQDEYAICTPLLQDIHISKRKTI
jgi:hypothetical protein